MPRKLPWLSKAASRPTKREPIDDNNDDDDDDDDDDERLFSGTVSAPPRKGKSQAKHLDSDDGFSEIPFAVRTKKTRLLSDHAPSSSPQPAVSELPPLKRDGIDESHLHDDEWMMVEDELLQTAKLFTRHLHLAEYERLKNKLQTRKKTPRPVVANARPSLEGQLKAKAHAPSKAQRKALKDDFMSSKKHRHEDILDTLILAPAKPSRVGPAVLSRSATHPPVLPLSFIDSQPPHGFSSSDLSEDDDLDVPRRSKPPSKKASASPSQSKFVSKPGSFTKPPLPSNPRPATSRVNLLDDFSLTKRSPSPAKVFDTSSGMATQSTNVSEPPVAYQSHPRTRSTASRPTFDLLNSLDFPGSVPVLKEQAERLAKRKAEKGGKDLEQEKRKSVKLDDIPTFLF
ncbi:uncharacterized protein BDR25DRAFT_313201 [Lindgomyces ingoldianus]|uniref:Uncharacterized protein n=1 Tax=Lindgomyces ingoldianus TaxID=673940 RepID=A0ACB6QY67_9PLEO|nr:uncharacterized protein BDR25DRAFT_313201 [Lindgomyces ingoldianus]KAF2471984.1 hypothetical protein BDR25DRAFT_313201 [Lindgomyces ingoldianus]